MNNFAKIEDVEKLWRSLTEDEKERAKNLLPIVEDSLRMEADKVGKNLERMIEEKSYLENVAKSVVVDVIARTLMTSTDAEPMTQRSESALGYSVPEASHYTLLSVRSFPLPSWHPASPLTFHIHLPPCFADRHSRSFRLLDRA